MKRLIVLSFVAMAAGCAANAADLTEKSVIPTLPQQVYAPAFLSELRLGLTAQDPTGPESGSVNLTLEALSPKLGSAADPLVNALIPRLHIGGSINLDHDTSFAYAGFTWTFDLTPSIFVEGSFGGAVHDGETDPIEVDREALGCRALFREAAALGFRLSPNWSLMGTIEHLSNAGLCSNNRGMTNFGVKVGYTF
ncbi:acyloxyacyl hydrolase [Microvirga lotononidis]|uniref:Lipid A 3-O-deacylase (PagL) n=1 Tax=Microvirga lotononidis TaxID=864069 RepID=I4YPU2_9HYPH|nr:acyloxyacyl hydrolase [Microvirga lotononidis]EIM25984.1 Lipid A 3-O-deacylase (PagL) [Microvirga lotononidis]WQO25893.1 acyloxyacyl hydrolase [Microvirga lotononidis]